MYRLNAFNCFYFNNHLFLYQQVDTKTVAQRSTFVFKRDSLLALNTNSTQSQFTRKRELVSRFQQTWPQQTMHLNCRTDHFARKIAVFHLCVLCVSAHSALKVVS